MVFNGLFLISESDCTHGYEIVDDLVCGTPTYGHAALGPVASCTSLFLTQKNKAYKQHKPQSIYRCSICM